MRMLKGLGIVSLAAVLVCGLVLLTGCQNTREKAAERMMENAISKASGGKANVDIRGGKVAVTTKDGTSEFSAGGTEWPADLTLDIPKVEGKIKSVFRTSTPQGKNWTIAMEGVAADVPAKYVKSLEEKGWTIALNSTTDQGGMAQATKDKNMVVLTYTNDNKGFVLNVTNGIAK
ncbi:MAG: hypothetical protein ABSA30_10200 [Candidatus Aminicenantales bacterium]